MRLLALLVVLVGCSSETQAPAETDPGPTGPCGHAHNDYEHPRPLQDALDAGMCSVEADIFLVGSDLLVAHEMANTDPARTLQSLYLDPLREAELSRPLTLLIDVKSDASATYTVLDNLLSQYGDILTQWDDGAVTERAVTAIISGNRDRDTMEAQATRYAALDGRITDLNAAVTIPTSLIPLVSDNWLFQVGWLGGEEIPADTLALLQGHVESAHAEGRRIRFWASPDTEEVWQVQRDVGVDLINTDDLSGLQAFLSQ